MCSLSWLTESVIRGFLEGTILSSFLTVVQCLPCQMASEKKANGSNVCLSIKFILKDSLAHYVLYQLSAQLDIWFLKNSYVTLTLHLMHDILQMTSESCVVLRPLIKNNNTHSAGMYCNTLTLGALL